MTIFVCLVKSAFLSSSHFLFSCLKSIVCPSFSFVFFANNSPSQNSSHPDDLFQSKYVTPGFKAFSYFLGDVT